MPHGAFLGAINKVGWFRVKRNDATCTHCYACDKACPVNVKVESVAQVQSSECINCSLCVNACPVKDTLTIGGPGKSKRTISSFAVLGITLGLFAAVVGVTTASGAFQWASVPLAETVKKTSTLNPEDIKGTDTFRQVSELSGIPKENFLNRFGISSEDFEKPIKDVAHRADSGFDTEGVREFVKEATKK